METAVAPLAQVHIAQAVAVLSRAFMPDPIFSHFFSEPSRRTAVFGAFFNAIVQSHIRFGHVYGATQGGTLVGAAVWRPSHASEPSTQDRAMWQAAEDAIRRLDPRAGEALFAGFAIAETGHPPVPHWYLCFVGVEPTLQGNRIGEKLLTPVLQAAEANGETCYLETPFARTHAFYRRLGFELQGASHPFAGAPMLWTMLRPATRS